ncbi:MAG: hypothetical protein PHY25_05290 [Dehalococcoidales bacterium]|jgi:hypothetical protein|nr:hypothetical protein [Limnochordia bacterium]MDD4466070.1 hypothetical protein [Dehalococcoidales bacterium]MDX9804040.1 hypothetical protein [Dehalococcoidales bacterium]
MNRHKIILLAINILGGMAVIGSYIYGINAQPGGADALWGGVPENARNLYAISMLIAAAGYFLFLYYLMFGVDQYRAVIGNKFNFGVIHLLFSLILVPSAFWMPLTNLYVENPATITWIGVVMALVLVGIGSLGLALALLIMKPSLSVKARRLAIAGSVYFTFHTLVMDAILWPLLFLQ